MKKKWLYILMCMILVMPLAAGCSEETGKSGQAGSGAGRYQEFITVDVYD